MRFAQIIRRVEAVVEYELPPGHPALADDGHLIQVAVDATVKGGEIYDPATGTFTRPHARARGDAHTTDGREGGAGEGMRRR